MEHHNAQATPGGRVLQPGHVPIASVPESHLPSFGANGPLTTWGVPMASKTTTGCPDRHLASISRRLMRGGPIDKAPDLIGTSVYGPLGRRRQMIDMTWSNIRPSNQDGRPEYLFGVLTSGRRQPFASRPALGRLIDAAAAGTLGPVFEEKYSRLRGSAATRTAIEKELMK